MLSFERSAALFARAARVIPGGIYGHTAPAATMPGRSPYYAQRAAGCRYWDVDGNEFIDFLCGYGVHLLGAQHPEVEEAAARQARDGNAFNHPTALMVELAERLVGLVDFADWAVFAKNGADVTSWCLQVAREHTGRKKVLKIAGAYHGSHAWCAPGHGGWIDEDRVHIHGFPWNDLNAFHDLVRQHRGQIAAVITTAFHHPAFGASELPAPGFFAELEATCRREGIVLVLDDIRSGFRLDLGGSHRTYGFTPDLACYCKALGNGHPISAAVGRAELKRAAGHVFLTGSYWNSAVPMAAALKVLEIAQRDDAVGRIARAGARFRAGFEAAAAKHGRALRFSGPDALPFVTFADDPDFFLAQRFCQAACARGVFLHPHHNWFLGTAHGDADVDQAIAAIDAALGSLGD